MSARVAILGFGLIGGSIARALARLPAAERPRVDAWSPSGAGAAAAVVDGVVDGRLGEPGEAWAAELIVLAAPPLACLDLLDELAATRPADAPATTVTDVASTKARLIERSRALGLRFVGGHPMAGLEVTGYGAARADLFDDRPWVVVPGGLAGASDVDRVEGLARSVGARPIRMGPEEHDRAVATISHLPLVTAVALVEAVVGGPGDPDRPDWPATRGLAAGGWAGMTRLALGDVEMGAGILATNADATAVVLRDLRDSIDGWLAELERAGGPDVAALRSRLRAARDRLMPSEVAAGDGSGHDAGGGDT
jgi:prephenate dehydrogenase